MEENIKRKNRPFRLRLASLMMVVMILLSSIGQVEATAILDIKAPAAILMDTDSGQILYGKNIDSQRAMASTSKLMTYLLVMDAVEEGIVNLNDEVRVSKNAEYAGGSSYRLKENDRLTVDELLNSLMIISANDSAVVLAEHLAGSVWNFSQQMNQKARELGLTSASFINPNGMPVSGKQNMISARDLGELSRHTINKHGDHLLNITSKKHFTGVYKKYSQKNTNDLLEVTGYVDGLKTGYTHLARFCLVSTARVRDSESNRLISVVMGSGTRAERARDTKLLLDYGLDGFANQTIKKGISIQVDGRDLSFEGAHPFIENETTLVPLRVITEELGAKVEWIGKERAVVVNKDGMNFKLIIDQKTASINDETRELSQAPLIVDGTTMVPIRFLAEELDLDVNWDDSNRRVEIFSLEKLNI